MKRTLIFFLCMCCVLGTRAQYGDNFVSLGDKAFDNKDYYEAAYYYKKAAEGMKLTSETAIPYQSSLPKKGEVSNATYISFRLAESYRNYENYLEAEGWYHRVLEQPEKKNYPLAQLWYGVSLRANQHFDEAINQLTQFKNTYKDKVDKYLKIAEKEISNCLFAKEQYRYPQLIEVSKINGQINSDGSNYAIVKHDQNYWFTSSRSLKDDKKHLNNIYFSSSLSAKPQLVDFNDDDIKDIEYGTPAINSAGNHIYFTRWYKEGSKIVHSIYNSTLSNGSWAKPEKLNSNINASGFNAIQPFVTADGKLLFFTSNKPGGKGGYDIWVSDLDENGTPVNSINLGNEINTEFDEQAPYYDVFTKNLVFSSKGFTGLGGFDFFKSKGIPGNWSKAENMGYPMNSAKDDLYYYPKDAGADKFFISSDRQSDCCLELFEVQDRKYFISGKVVDCDEQTPLAGVNARLLDSLSGKTIEEKTLGKDGKYAFRITTSRPYNMVFEKSGYFTKTVPYIPSMNAKTDTLKKEDICLQAFEVGKPIVIKNILYDYDKATLRPESKTVLDGLVQVMRDNPKIRIELGSHTDSKGSDEYNMNLSKERAQSCVDYITSQGISENNIFARGYGESKPIAPNTLANGDDNPEGRQLNRRTEFTVLKLE